MKIKYDILEYTINALVEKLMNKYKCSYESALEIVLNSALYARLQQESWLLEEGDIYLFNLLDSEYNADK